MSNGCQTDVKVSALADFAEPLSGTDSQARACVQRREVVAWYLEGLHWVLEYYYRGVASWDWYYPFHYGPFLSDLTELSNISATFVYGSPVLPYQQLLSVLPQQSAALLPRPFRPLMLDPRSPIADFYPLEFATDGEGKRQEWEAVVLVPFISKARLMAAYATVDQSALTAEEKACNAHGLIHVRFPARLLLICQSVVSSWRDHLSVLDMSVVSSYRQSTGDC